MNNKNTVTIIMVATLIITIIGGTFAYWNWQSTTVQKTNVTFTVAQGFTCGADGGGDITNADVTLAPAACTNPAYAIQRTVTVSTTQDAGKTIVLDMWLKINSIATNLSSSENFKYALTDSASGCTDAMINDGDTDHVIASGTFNGKTAGSQVLLLDEKEYSQTTASDVYYLYIWLDAAETNSNTMNQSFNFTVEGSCTDEQRESELENWVYTANVLGDGIYIGSPIPEGVDKFYNPNGGAQAMAKLNEIWGEYGVGFHFYQKHKLDNYGNVLESYIEFVINDDYRTQYIAYECEDTVMEQDECESYYAQKIAGAVNGTYAIRVGVDESSYGEGNQPIYESNISILNDALGDSICPLPDEYDSYYDCGETGLTFYLLSNGRSKIDYGASSYRCGYNYYGNEGAVCWD